MSEHDTQCAFVKWMKIQHPNVLFWATPNIGTKSEIRGVKLKREGVLSGVPDIMIARKSGEYPAMFIEFKHGKNGLSETQKTVKAKLESEGYLVAVCYSWLEAKNAANDYLA